MLMWMLLYNTAVVSVYGHVCTGNLRRQIKLHPVFEILIYINCQTIWVTAHLYINFTFFKNFSTYDADGK